MTNKLLELVRTMIGHPYLWGAQGEKATSSFLQYLKNTYGASHYEFDDSQGHVSATKWVNDEDPKEAFDCSGLIVWGLRKLSVIPKDADYNAEMLFNQLCTPITKDKLLPGDLVFVVKGGINHVGIYAGNGQTIEANSTRYGVIVGNVNTFNLYGRLKYDLSLPFTDIAGHWGEEAIKAISNKGYITGYPDGTFKPDMPVTRAELCAILKKIGV